MSGGDARSPPEGLDRRRIAKTRFQVEWVTETGSTNADLVAAALAGGPDGSVLVADHQTAGRGRRDRSWEAPPGASLLVSLLLRPTLEPAALGVLTAAVGLSARAACGAVARVDVGLKWPNDLLVTTADGERKLGGILAESVVVGDRVEAVVVGLGLNVTWPVDLPVELSGIAVALNHLGADSVDRGALLTAMLADLDDRLVGLRTGPAADRDARPEWQAEIWEEWREATTTLGRQVTVELADGEVTGRAVDLTAVGHLVVQTQSGRRVIDVGDVVHLR